MKLLAFCPDRVPASSTVAALERLAAAVSNPDSLSSSAATPPRPIDPTSIAPSIGRQAPDPRTIAADQPAAGETPAAVPPTLPLSLGLLLSLEVESIAKALYHANAIRLDAGDPPIAFDQLHATVRVAYRDAAIVAIQRIDPRTHESAIAAARAVVPGFEAALDIYITALQYGPAVAR